MSITTQRPEEVEAPEAEQPRSRRKLVVIVLVLLVAAAAAWFFLLRPTGPEEPVPGEVLTLDPIQVNLAEGHYLRIGLALQLTADAHEADGSKALDAAIDLFSGVGMSDLARTSERNEFQDQLEERLHEAYHGEVMEVYFTEFVTQ